MHVKFVVALISDQSFSHSFQDLEQYQGAELKKEQEVIQVFTANLLLIYCSLTHAHTQLLLFFFFFFFLFLLYFHGNSILLWVYPYKLNSILLLSVLSLGPSGKHKTEEQAQETRNATEGQG